MKTVLVARLDSDGDVLLAGPAVRAVAAGADRVVLLCGPRGRAAAELLPGVDDVVVWHCPWIDAEPSPVDRPSVERLVDRVRARGVDEALVLTSYHQDPLPLALLLRLAGVGRIAAVSEDYPGSLLDVRHRLPETGLHEVERMLSLAAAAGFWPPAGDDGMLAVRSPLPDTRALTGNDPYVVMHPGASVQARAPSPQRAAAMVDALVTGDRRVLVTGSPGERPLTAQVAGAPRAGRVCDLGGRTDLARLADVLSRADAVVVGNTGPAHLAAAVGTPVVSPFAPTVPAVRWRPWGVEHELLRRDVPCAGCRARACPVPGHPCLSGVSETEALAAVERLAPMGRLDRAAPRPPARLAA